MNKYFLLSKIETIDNNILYNLIDLKGYDSINVERFMSSFKSYIIEEKPESNFINEPLEKQESVRDALLRRSKNNHSVLSQFDFTRSLLPITDKTACENTYLPLKIVEIVTENELFNASDYIEIINQK